MLWTALLLLSALPAAAENTKAEPRGEHAELRFVPHFEADTTQAPEVQPWARAAESICQVWYPKVVGFLKSDDSFRPLPPTVKIVFDVDMKIPAYVSGSEMHIWVNWIKTHPNDTGMVVHELTHMVQRYNRARAGWLVEGMADFIRQKYFEPNVTLPKINFEKAKYTDSYKTTASFLTWADGKYGPDLVPKLHALLRDGKYTDDSFKDLTGKEVTQLWAEFAESQGATVPAAAAPAAK